MPPTTTPTKTEHGYRAGCFGCGTWMFLLLTLGAIDTWWHAAKVVDTSKLPAGMLDCAPLEPTIRVVNQQKRMGYYVPVSKLPAQITIQLPSGTAINGLRHVISERLVVGGKAVHEIQNPPKPGWGDTLKTLRGVVVSETKSSLTLNCERDIPLAHRVIHSWIELEGNVHYVSPIPSFPGSNDFSNVDYQSAFQARILFVSDDEANIARMAKGVVHAQGQGNGPLIAAIVTFCIGSLLFVLSATSLLRYFRTK